jgi:hypothetical protein
MGRIDEIRRRVNAMQDARTGCGRVGFEAMFPPSQTERDIRYLLVELDRMDKANNDACDKIHGVRR